MITPEQLRQMKAAFNGLSSRLAIQKKLSALALERLEDAERQRDELAAACDALSVAIRDAEEGGKQESAAEGTKGPTADSRNSSHSMVGELGGNIPAPAEEGKRTRKSRKGGTP